MTLTLRQKYVIFLIANGQHLIKCVDGRLWWEEQREYINKNTVDSLLRKQLIEIHYDKNHFAYLTAAGVREYSQHLAESEEFIVEKWLIHQRRLNNGTQKRQ